MIERKIIIELRADGKVYVTGMLHEKDICNAMLDEAKEVVKNYKRELIIKPTINGILKNK